MMRKNDIRREVSPPPALPRTAPATPLGAWRGVLLRAGAAMALAVGLLALAYQLPVTHRVDIGGYDAAYVQGFYDAEPTASPALAGSDGSARWTHATSYLLFPQAGLPAQVTLHLRAPRGASVWLNGAAQIGAFKASAAWQEQTFTLSGGLLKPSDVVIELRAPPAPASQDDARTVGVLLDRAAYRVGPAPVTPYPAQLAYGALAVGLLVLLLGKGATRRGGEDAMSSPPFWRRLIASSPRRIIICCCLVPLGWFLLYRSQPLYPYPLRALLPALVGALAAALALRHGTALVARAPALLDALALGGVALWLVAVLRGAQAHVVESLPGVESDFRVFALRSAHLWGSFPAGTQNPAADGVLRADGFYNLLYPLLLWLVRPLTHDNAFLAAQWVAAASGALLVLAAWWLARGWLGRGAALLVVLLLALSPLLAQYALYVGTDMPFAALCTLALALLIRGQRSEVRGQKLAVRGQEPGARSQGSACQLVILAGIAAGAAFLVRHPGILLLPVGWLWISSQFSVLSSELLNNDQSPVTENSKLRTQNAKRKTQNLLLFTLAFLITVSPQLAVNAAQTGNVLFNQQAKNIWLAVYAGGDWERWGEVPDSIPLAQVLLTDPPRVLANWWANVRGFLGAGGEQTSEFERAIQLRLLGFPANWLAVVGLLGWLYDLQFTIGDVRLPRTVPARSAHPRTRALLLWVALYVAAVSIGLGLPRFALPLVPVYALAAAWAVRAIGNWQLVIGDERKQLPVASYELPIALLLVALLWGGFATGTGYVLDNQAGDEVAAARLVQATLHADERVIVRASPRSALGKYSAIAHLVAPAPPSDDPAALRATGARYLLTSGAAPKGATLVPPAGAYTLYRLPQ